MIEQISPFLAFERTNFYQDMVAHERLLLKIAGEEIPMTWSEWAYDIATWSNTPRPLRTVNKGWGTGPIRNTYTAPMQIFGQYVRAPLEGRDQNNVLLTSLGPTNEYIHPVVAYRIKKSASAGTLYAPESLKGWIRNPCKTGKGFEYVKDDLVLPEYKISKPEDGEVNLERLAVDGDAVEWLEELDKVNGL
jgi:hypothetical protein